MFFSGLSGAGKSVVAVSLKNMLLDLGRDNVVLLDGDMFRSQLARDQECARGFRATNTLRIAEVAKEVTRAGGVALCAAIAPREELRARARKAIEHWGAFVLVYLSTPLSVCEGRDVNGLYRMARNGALDCLTGVTDPYEIPERADLTIDTSHVGVEAAVSLIVDYLQAKGLVSAQ